MNICTPSSVCVSMREAWTGPPDSVSTVRAYVPFSPAGTGAVTAWVVPPLTVYVSVAGVPPRSRGRRHLDLGGVLAGNREEQGRALGGVARHGGAVADGRARGEEGHFLLLAGAADHPQGRHDRGGLARPGRCQQQRTRLAARQRLQVGGGRHPGLDADGLLHRRGDRAVGAHELDPQLGIGVPGGVRDQLDGCGVRRDAGQDQGGGGSGGRGEPVAAELVDGGLHGGADPAAARGDVGGDVGGGGVGGEGGQQYRHAGPGGDTDAVGELGLEGAFWAVQLDVDDGGGVVGVGEVDVVAAVLGRGHPGEPEVRVRCGAAQAEQPAGATRRDQGGLLGGPAGGEAAGGQADEGGGGGAVGLRGDRCAGGRGGEDGLVRRRVPLRPCLLVLLVLPVRGGLLGRVLRLLVLRVVRLLRGGRGVLRGRRRLQLRLAGLLALLPAGPAAAGRLRVLRGVGGVRRLRELRGAGRGAEEAAALHGQQRRRRGARGGVALPGAATAARPVRAARAVAAARRERVLRFTGGCSRRDAAGSRGRTGRTGRTGLGAGVVALRLPPVPGRPVGGSLYGWSLEDRSLWGGSL